uniref:Uncharacterized protein n=1 Tax=Oncorhynchus mykiss TaxID=8022 RepID=A0A8C7P8N2_ONCMY
GVVLCFLFILPGFSCMFCYLSKSSNEKKGYDISGQGLPGIPDELPSSTKTLDFSFNYLPAINNTTFVRLKELVSMNLTRLVTSCNTLKGLNTGFELYIK